VFWRLARTSVKEEYRMSGSSKQDPRVKGNPFAATWDERLRHWTVQSASGKGRYIVDPDQGRCTCESPHRCWHLGIIPLADQIASVQAAARSHYAGWRLADLQAEDAGLRAVVATAEAGTGRRAWFELAQLSVVGDEILDRLASAGGGGMISLMIDERELAGWEVSGIVRSYRDESLRTLYRVLLEREEAVGWLPEPDATMLRAFGAELARRAQLARP
jgi:hypothetical protein